MVTGVQTCALPIYRTTDHADVNVQTGTNNIFGNPTVKSTTTTTTTTAQ